MPVNVAADVRGLHVQSLTDRIEVLEAALEETRATATKAAEEAIGLFLEYRDVHGWDEDAAAAAALHEICEGLHAAEDIAAWRVETDREGIS